MSPGAPRIAVFSRNFDIEGNFLEKFLHCNSKTHCCILSKLSRYVHYVKGMCCIVFDLHGILLEFLAPLCHLAAELFKCRLVRRRRPTFLEIQIPGGEGGGDLFS